MKRAGLIARVFACDPRPTAAPTSAPAGDAGPVTEPASVAATSEPAREPPPADDASTRLPAVPVFAAGPFAVRVGQGKVLPPTRAFEHQPSEEMMLDHVWASGWNRQGLDALARQDLAGAATAFVAATYADVGAWKGPYNLACAYARAGDPRAQAALTAAVERGGEAVRRRATTDKDLDSVRALAWFVALMKP